MRPLSMLFLLVVAFFVSTAQASKHTGDSTNSLLWGAEHIDLDFPTHLTVPCTQELLICNGTHSGTINTYKTNSNGGYYHLFMNLRVRGTEIYLFAITFHAELFNFVDAPPSLVGITDKEGSCVTSSGVKYIVTGNARANLQVHVTEITTIGAVYHVIGKGRTPDYKIHSLVHLTINANGKAVSNITSSHEVQCWK